MTFFERKQKALVILAFRVIFLTRLTRPSQPLEYKGYVPTEKEHFGNWDFTEGSVSLNLYNIVQAPKNLLLGMK